MLYANLQVVDMNLIFAKSHLLSKSKNKQDIFILAHLFFGKFFNKAAKIEARCAMMWFLRRERNLYGTYVQT